MKLVFKISYFLTIFFISIPAFADDSYHFETCKEKITAVESQISYAQQHNNQSKLAKLQATLYHLQTHCTDTNLQKKYQKKVTEKQQKIAERTQELQESQQDGNKRKISSKEAKLTHAKNELSATQQAFEIFKSKVSMSHLISK